MVKIKNKQLKCLFDFHTWTYGPRSEHTYLTYIMRECKYCHLQQARWVMVDQNVASCESDWAPVEDKYYSSIDK